MDSSKTLLLLTLAIIIGLPGLIEAGPTVCPQDEQGSSTKAAETKGSTVKGRLVQHENENFKIAFGELNPTFDQRVKLPSAPLPGNWKDLTVEARQKWIKDFDASDAGKALAEKRKATLEAAASFKIQTEENGNFVIFDVPDGTYGLRGRVEKDIEGKNYVFEVFGQVVVTKDVEEVLLDPIAVTVTRLTKRTEEVPQFEVETFDGKRKITEKMIKGRPVLINFWSLESPPSLEFAKTVQTAYLSLKESHELHLVSICIGSDRKKALQHVLDNDIRSWHGYAKSWEHAIVNEFGVRVIPALFLVNTEGNLLMTNGDFRFAFQSPDAELPKILTDAIEGKMVPTRLDDEVKDGEQGSESKEGAGSEPKDGSDTNAGSEAKQGSGSKLN